MITGFVSEFSSRAVTQKVIYRGKKTKNETYGRAVVNI